MGYEDILAAETLHTDGGMLIEICLLGPSSLPAPADEYHVAVHADCDPDRPWIGTSSMEDCGKDLEGAKAYYRSRLSELTQPQQKASP
jgi:hypothetical protein